MSLSKLRRCKVLLLACGMEVDLELSTVALSYVYLERLCWRNVVDKRNRKLLSAVCLTLAYKYNEGIGQAQRRKRLGSLFAVSDRSARSAPQRIAPHRLTPVGPTAAVLCRAWSGCWR